MNAFRYLESASVGEAVTLLSGESRGKFLAGGTTLVDLMKLRVEEPEALVDINPLPLSQIDVDETGAHIGAMVRNSDLAYHPEIQRRYPMLTEALLSGASPQLRNMATVGGNILQRTRCPYFREPDLPCNKRRPASGCGALTGFNRIHAVLGGSDTCIATHPSDMCVAMVALDAVVDIAGPSGERRVPLTDFHLLPGTTPERENVLGHGELITGVHLPDLPFARRSHYLKVRDRASYEFALVSAAVALDVDGGTIRAARVALGGVGTKPWRSHEAERILTGSSAGEQSYREAADAALAGAAPRRDNWFKIDLAKATLVRALQHVEGRA